MTLPRFQERIRLEFQVEAIVGHLQFGQDHITCELFWDRHQLQSRFGNIQIPFVPAVHPCARIIDSLGSMPMFASYSLAYPNVYQRQAQ